MSDEAFRTQIFKTLIDHWPAPLFGSDRQLDQIVDLTNRLVRTMKTHGVPLFDNGQHLVDVIKSNAGTEYAYTLHDAITFAIRDNLPPRVWADADDIAAVAISAVADFRNSVSADVFLDNVII